MKITYFQVQMIQRKQKLLEAFDTFRMPKSAVQEFKSTSWESKQEWTENKAVVIPSGIPNLFYTVTRHVNISTETVVAAVRFIYFVKLSLGTWYIL